MKLDRYDIAILSELAEDASFCTAEIDVQVVPWNRRSNSQVVLRRLKSLELRGLVARLDDEKPVAWVRAKAGTDALKALDTGVSS